MPRLKLFLFLVFFSKCFLPSGNAQTAISGIINSYTNVDSIIDADSIIVGDVSDFTSGDTVLLIQVKGIGINVTDAPAQFGLSQNVYGAGKYEFLIIDTIHTVTKLVTFTGDMGNFGDYDAGGALQLVRVRGYDNARVTGTLTCEPWDSTAGTGGVLAMIVGNTLTLEADIDVTGKGLKGGTAFLGTNQCSYLNPSRYDHVFFHEDSLTAGYKGEGAASYALDNTAPLGMAYKKGRGPLFNGGGGGNAKYSGGAGGGNYGSGGAGGFELESCIGGPYAIGGKEGRDVTSLPDLVSGKRIFMGGGGGSATQNSDGDATDGGNGGGIIIIVADTLIGNGNSIKANGADVSGVTTANGGAGGGGAGGTILLEVNGFKSSNLTVEMKGGKGGDSGAGSGSCTGPGGGGGGGAFWYSIAALPAEGSVDATGGDFGNSNCGLYWATEGSNGGTISGLRVPLTGFLFNSIFSFYTGADHDTICESDTPPKILGTAPKGGTPPYEYQWRSSTDNINWDSIEVDWTTLQRDYYPVYQLFDTIYYRRYVRDQSVPQILDISKVLTLIVQPKIQQNSLSFDTTICNGQVPNPIIPVFPSPKGGDGIYTYSWEKSVDAIDFDLADGVYNAAIYSPPALTNTTYFRRTVYSGKCQHTSDTVTVNVLPLIGNNSVTADQIICEGIEFNSLDGQIPTGGDETGIYTFQWIESSDSSTWVDAFGPDTGEDYSPDTTSTGFPGTLYFSRVVYSGPADCCIDTSNLVTLTDWPMPSASIDVLDTTVCSGSPVDLTFRVVGANGPWNLIYTDETTPVTISIPTTTAYKESITKTTDQETVSYTYTISSLVDAKGCIAPLADLTGQAKITLNGIPVADAGVDDEVCGLTYTLQAVAGSFGTGQWTFPAVVTDASDDTNPNKVVQVNAEGTYTFTWVVTNGVCAPVSDDVQIIFWEQPDVADAGTDQDLDPGKTETYLEGNLPTGGTGLWTKYQADAPAVIADPSDPSTEVTNLTIGDNKFVWTISSGICPAESDEVVIKVNIISPPNVFTPNGDGINDFYVIPGIENRKNELIVVNRLGTKVFGAESYQNDWEGKYKGEDLPEDVYYYILYIYWDDDVEKISGYIVIKRK